MRILTVADFMYPQVKGGSSVVVHEVMRRLSARGHEITLLTRGSHETPASVDGMPVSWYAPAPTEVLYPLSVARCLWRLRGALAPDQFDIVNAHHAYSGLGVELRRTRSRVPSVYYFHGSWEGEAMAKDGQVSADRGQRKPRWRYRTRSVIERYILESCTKVVGLSDFSRSEVGAIAPTALEKYHKIPGGVDTERFQPAEDPAAIRRRLGLPAEALVVLTIRRLVPRMGLENLLVAMKRIEVTRDDVSLIIGGQGPLYGTLAKLAAELELRRVRLLGFVSESELPSYYQIADLFVMPSVALEGFGLTTLEAFACGTPVLATPVGANPEVLGGVLDEFILKGVDAETIASGILEKLPVVRDPDLRRRLRAHAQGLSWDVIADRVEALFFEEVEACRARNRAS